MTIHLFIYINIIYLSYDAIDKVESSIPEIPDDPNDRYISNTIKIKTLSDADSFCNTYNHDNGYNGLKIGQTIQIYYNSHEGDFHHNISSICSVWL